MALSRKTVKELEQEQSDKVMNVVAWRCAFYRENPQRFVQDFLHINLKWFQAIILIMWFFHNYNMYIAARAQGKTFLLAIFCVCKCVLYPGTIICIASKTKKQSAEVINKIATIILPNAPLLRAEIDGDILNNNVEARINFKNTSIIRTVVANDNARSGRATILLVDESRLVPTDILNLVLRKFLGSRRHPGFLDKPEYRDYPQEENSELYCSSAWYESHDLFKKAQGYCANSVLPDRSFFICALPYQLSIKEGLLSRNQVTNEMSEQDFSALLFRMEMEALFLGSSGNDFFQFDELNNTRKIPYAWTPSEYSSRLNDKRIRIPQKQPGETRIMSVDIALMASSKKRNNDAASLMVNSMVPMHSASNRFMNNIMYTENFEGMRSDDLALTIRKAVDEFGIDYLAIDTKGNGLPIVDLLMGDLYDNETGITYEALGCFNNEEINDRCVSKTARKVIWSIMGSENFNSQCAVGLRESFRQGTIRLLKDDGDCKDILQNLNGYSKLPQDVQSTLQMPYKHTTLLINELINLQVEPKNNTIRVHEKSGMRKDRYSSLSYNIYVAKELERTMNKPRCTPGTMLKMVGYRAPVIC